MKRKLVTLLLSLSALFGAAGLAACGDDTHVHDNKYYTVQQATCTEKGLMEVLCATCGEKSYQEVMPVGHIMAEGVCTVCGYVEGEDTSGETPDTPQTPTSPTDFSAFYNIDDLYGKFPIIADTVTIEEFYQTAGDLYVDALYVNSLGLLKASANDFSVNLGAISSLQTQYVPSQTPAADQIIRCVSIEDNQMQVIFANGTSRSLGRIVRDTSFIDETTENLLASGYSIDYIMIYLRFYADCVIGITVNVDNQVFVRMGDNRIVFVGTLLEDKTDTNNSALIYQKTENSYTIVGCMDIEVESIEIPPTHLGLPVIVSEYAFYYCNKLKEITVNEYNTSYQSIDGNLYTKDGETLVQYAVGKTATEFTVPSSVTTLGSFAFRGCTSLTSVVIPSSLLFIGNCVFENCSSLTSIVLPNSLTYIGRYAFWSCVNLKNIYYAGTESDKNIWIPYTSFSTTATWYYYSESQPTDEGNYWHYVNGTPTVWE